MRMLVKIEARGDTLRDVVYSLEKEWKRFSGNDKDDIPYDSEVTIEKIDGESEYVATCTIRARRDK